MNLSELKEITNNAFSHPSYQVIDDEPQIVGKFCRCVYLGNDVWDVWLCNPKNLHDGLSQRKITSMRARISENYRHTGPYQELTGEGVYSGMPTELLVLNRSVLGIKKRKQLSDEHKDKLKMFK